MRKQFRIGRLLLYMHSKNFAFYENDLTIHIGPFMWIIMWKLVKKAEGTFTVKGKQRHFLSWNFYYYPNQRVTKHWSFHL